MNCILCKTESRPLEDTKFGVLYYLCPNCECIFTDPKDIPNSEDEKARYDTHNNSIEDEGYVNMFEQFIDKAVTPYIQTPADALDFGCGPGPVLAELLERRGFDVDKFDPYYFPEKIYEEKIYDLITSTEVFEHMSDPLSAMETISSRLQQGGILGLMTHFHKNNDEEFLSWWYKKDSTHITFYTHKTFAFLAKKFGFEIVYLDDKNVCVLKKVTSP